jgi:hypothetical protein
VKILTARDYPNIPRRVVWVVLNPDDPRWVHPVIGPDGPTEVFTPSPWGHTGDIIESGTVCKECRFNHQVEEFVFTRDELQLGLNKWGNPTHDDQQTVSSRDKTWDELYAEVDARLGEHVEFDDAPRESVPSLTPETELDFELIPTGDPHFGHGCCDLPDGEAHQRFKFLRLGKTVSTVFVAGSTKEEFVANRDEWVETWRAATLAAEAQQSAAEIIVS